jgi:hypothetical protein
LYFTSCNELVSFVSKKNKKNDEDSITKLQFQAFFSTTLKLQTVICT